MTVAELLIALNEYEDDVEVMVGYLNGSTIMGTDFTLLESVDQETRQPMVLLMTEEYKHIFKNTKGANNAPEYTGEIMVNGKKMRLAAWVKEGKSGKFFSGKMSEPREQSPSRHQENDSQGTGDLPF